MQGRLSFRFGLFDDFQQFGACRFIGTMYCIAHDALIVNHDSQGKALCADPRHHVLCLDEVCPREVVLVGDTLGRLCIVEGG